MSWVAAKFGKTRTVEVLDTTLRDGAQTRGVTFSLKDKLAIAQRLDHLGIHIIEGGWPASNPKDADFFRQIRKYGLTNSKIAAFTTTKRKRVEAEKDPSLQAVVEAEPALAVVVGKASDFQVTQVLNCTLEENLEMIETSVKYLHSVGLPVYFDAEHFFDGFTLNRDYALKVLQTAVNAGSSCVVLCDTNGGSLSLQVHETILRVRREIQGSIGIHAHNDSGCAVANTIVAVQAGASHVQGTINGIGERTGNADLCQILPDLDLKLDFEVLTTTKPRKERLRKLTELSRYLYELTGLPSDPYQPYVGKFAFAHKAGLHVNGVAKSPTTYEHLDPALVGNTRLHSVSEMSGKSNILTLAKKFRLKLNKNSSAIKRVLEAIKHEELKGASLDNADATCYLLLVKELGRYNERFQLISWNVHSEKTVTKASIKIQIYRKLVSAESSGIGPVHALDQALRKALMKHLDIETVKLANYKVAVVGLPSDTASVVRVFIEFSDGERTWSTVSASTNIIEASLSALLDGYDYYLHISKQRGN